MKISEAEKKPVVVDTDSIPVGAANSPNAYRVTMQQVKQYVTQGFNTGGDVTKDYVDTELAKKQPIIPDLATIRNNASEINALKSAVESLPDGSAVSAQVAENTAKLSTIYTGIDSEVAITLNAGQHYKIGADGKVATVSNSSSKSGVVAVSAGVYKIKSYCNGERRIIVTDKKFNIITSIGGEAAYRDYYVFSPVDGWLYVSGINNSSYPTSAYKIDEVSSALLALQSMSPVDGIVISPSNSISYRQNANKSVDVTFAETRYNVYMSNGNVINITTTAGASYNIPGSYTLIFDLADMTIKVVAINNAALYNGSIILAHNERGIIVFGVLAELAKSKKARLSGKRICILGDSITEKGKFTTALEWKAGVTIYNRGASGTSMAISRVDSAMCQRVDYPTSNTVVDYKGGMPSADNIDMFIIFGGTNDFLLVNSGITFGSIYDTNNKNTFCGAVHYIIKRIKQLYPNKPIVILTPMHMQGNADFANAQEFDISDGVYTLHKNGTNNTLHDYINALKEIGTMYGLPVVDMRNAGFSAIIADENAAYYDGDGLHPSTLGGEKMADYVIPLIEDLLCK